MPPDCPRIEGGRRPLDSHSHLLFQSRPPTSKHFETPDWFWELLFDYPGTLKFLVIACSFKKFTGSFKFLANSLLYFVRNDISIHVENVEVSKSSIQCGYTPSIGGKVSFSKILLQVHAFTPRDISQARHLVFLPASPPGPSLLHQLQSILVYYDSARLMQNLILLLFYFILW